MGLDRRPGATRGPRCGCGRPRFGTPRPPLGHEHPVRTERRHRADYRADVARVGHAVQGDQQGRGLLQRGGHQVVEVLVRERRHLQADALMQHPAGHPVQLGPADLQDRDAAVAGAPDDLIDPLVDVDALGDIERRGRHAGAQRLHHRVAAEQQLRPFPGGVGPATGRDPGTTARRHLSAALRAGLGAPTPGGVLRARDADLGRAALGGRGPAFLLLLAGGLGGQFLGSRVALVPRPLVGRQGLAPALEPGAVLSAGADVRALLGGGPPAAVRPITRHQCCSPTVQRGPVGVSST